MGRKSTWSDDELLELLRLRDLGMTVREVADRLGRPVGSVQRTLKAIRDDYAAPEAGHAP